MFECLHKNTFDNYLHLVFLQTNVTYEIIAAFTFHRKRLNDCC